MELIKPKEISLNISSVQGLANNLENEDWYKGLIDDCAGIITESVFNSRWELIRGYHQLGERILQENKNFERSKIYGKEIVSRASQSLGKSSRTVARAIQFVRMYPDINMLPDGKNISWHKICNKLLPESTECGECFHKDTETIKRCQQCHKILAL